MINFFKFVIFFIGLAFSFSAHSGTTCGSTGASSFTHKTIFASSSSHATQICMAAKDNNDPNWVHASPNRCAHSTYTDNTYYPYCSYLAIASSSSSCGAGETYNPAGGGGCEPHSPSIPSPDGGSSGGSSAPDPVTCTAEWLLTTSPSSQPGDDVYISGGGGDTIASDGCGYSDDFSREPICELNPTDPDFVDCYLPVTPSGDSYPPPDVGSSPAPASSPSGGGGTCQTSAQQTIRNQIASYFSISFEFEDCPNYIVGYTNTTPDLSDACYHRVTIYPDGDYFDATIGGGEGCLSEAPTGSGDGETPAPYDNPSGGGDSGGGDSGGGDSGGGDSPVGGSDSSPSLGGGGTSDGGEIISESGSPIGTGEEGETSPTTGDNPQVPEQPQPVSCDPLVEDCDGKTVGLLEEIRDGILGEDTGQFFDDVGDVIINEQDSALLDQEKIAKDNLSFGSLTPLNLINNLFNFPSLHACQGSIDQTIFGYRFYIDPCVEFQPLRDILAWVFFVLGSFKLYEILFSMRGIRG